MAGELGALMHGAAEAKRQLFASEDFADGYGRTVMGRVKRRRAATTTAIGGGTLVAVGVLAVGGAHIVRTGFGLGVAGGSASVVCTTTPPDAPSASADNALSVLHVPSPSGSEMWAVAVGNQEPPKIVANITLNFQTREVTGSIPDGNSMVLTPESNGDYAVQFSDGNMLTFVVKGDELVFKSSTLEPTGPATVTCVTASPAPTTSPAPSATPARATSPFQCGYVFSTVGHSNANLDIGYIDWVPAAQAVAAIGSQWEQPEDAPLQVSGELVPVTQIQMVNKWLDDTLPGRLTLGDPADLDGPSTADEFRDAAGNYDVGMRYVLGHDGTVVATMSEPGGDQPQYMESNEYGALLYGLDLEGGMVACPGVDEATLADADVIAVAGIAYLDGNEIKGPFYAWNEAVRP